MSRDSLLASVNDTQAFPQRLEDFLAKPIVLASGNFSTTDTYSFFNSLSMPYTALTNAQGAMYLNKLKGYFGFRANMRFKLVINANRFQQGRYMVGFTPLCSPGPTTSQLKNLAFNNMHNASLVQRTTVPHVEIDLATATSAELLVPFMSPDNFYPLSDPISGNDNYPLGYVNLYPYSPLVSPAGSTVASYTLYVSFEDIRLFGAASPQSGISDKEVTNKQNGIISGVALPFAEGFQRMSEWKIPMLSEMAHDIGWVLNLIGGAASAFGFNKPIQGDSLTKMMILNNPSHSNVDGDSAVRTLSIFQRPGVNDIKGIFGSDYDEMDFSYVVRKFAWFQTTSWTTSSVIGNLVNIPVRPSVGVVGLGGAIHFTPLAFVADQFEQWRGSIVFRFKLVKTEFHSGRLSFAFYPTDEVATYVSDPYYVNRVIVDIREHSEMEIVVPYISRKPWTQAGNPIGFLAVDVVDPLVAPATVSSSISILTEIAGGEDFEVALPNSFQYGPILMTPQSGIDQSIFRSTIGDTSITSSKILGTSSCVGDKITSFRALLKRFTKFRPVGDDFTVELDTFSFNMPVDIVPVLSATVPTTYWNTDHYGLIASCYGMVRGGVRIRDICNLTRYSLASGTVNMTALINTVPAEVVYNPSVIGQAVYPISRVLTPVVDKGPVLHRVIQMLNNNSTLDLEVPQYTRGMARSVVDMLSFQGSSASLGYNGNEYATTTRGQITVVLPHVFENFVNVLAAPSLTYPVHNVYRSAAEDTYFGVFISVPSMVALSGASNEGF